MILRKAKINGNKIRVIYDATELSGMKGVYTLHSVKVQIKKIFFFITIKEWSHLTMDYIDDIDYDEIEFIKNEGIELFNHIYDPYKI